MEYILFLDCLNEDKQTGVNTEATRRRTAAMIEWSGREKQAVRAASYMRGARRRILSLVAHIL